MLLPSTILDDNSLKISCPDKFYTTAANRSSVTRHSVTTIIVSNNFTYLVVLIPKLRQMHPTLLRLARVIPRRLLKVSDHKISKRPTPQTEDRTRPTLIDLLEVQKKKAGESWPPNLRLERQLRSEDFKLVRPEVKSALKNLTKER